MSKRIYCMDLYVCDQSCNIADFYCKYYDREWPAKENCGCPPHTHWGFNHDPREIICFFKNFSNIKDHEIEYKAWKFGPSVVLKHNTESNHCDTCVRLINHIRAQMINNDGGILDLYGLKISYDAKGKMTMA